jgi:Clp amino terminal domain, pathogenicity island component
MTEFPVPLDNLIAYVKTIHPDGGPLENVSDAFAVSTQLDEQSDALIGYFVDQARKSGLSWSQIGSAMGVTKQAAQKRFVPSKAADLFPEGHAKPFSRFTARARSALLAAGQLAAAEGKPALGVAHLAAAQLSEPDGFAAKIITAAGLTAGQVYAALGTGPAEKGTAATTEALLDLSLGEDVQQSLKLTLRWALRLGHNYIGTEHLLLGAISLEGPVQEALAGLGLTEARAGQVLTDIMSDYQAGVKGVRDSLGKDKPAADPGA